MSWWTDFRDGLESVVAIAANFFLPGSGALIGQFVSEGAQERLSGGPAQIAMMAAGLGGGAAGNFSNYGAAMNAMSGAGAGGAAGGIVGEVGAGATMEQAAQAQILIDRGMPAMDAYQAVGVAPSGAGAAGGAVPAQYGSTGSGAPSGYGMGGATEPAVPSSGAAPTFSGQQMAGPYGGPTGGISNVGTLSAGGIAPQAQGEIAKAAGAMPWGSIGNVAGLLQGAASLVQANNMPNYQAVADPFAPYRKEYGDRLAALERDPSSITRIPGYEAGLQAVRRSMNARGYGGSGNMMAALAKYGGDFYNQTANRYASLAGGGVSPVSGAQIAMQGDMNKYNLIRAGIGNFGYAGNMAGNTWPGAA